MKEKQEYIRDIAEMRSMMERSSKLLSLSGLAAIILGVYALVGAYIAFAVIRYQPNEGVDSTVATGGLSAELQQLILLAGVVLVLALGTAVYLSAKKARKMGEKLWNPTARRVLFNMAVPLVAGGVLILVLLLKGFTGFMAPLTLVFYGLSLYNVSKYTYEEMRSLGLIQVVLGLAGAYYVEYGLYFWALGFGVMHIVYGLYIHYRHER